MLRSGIKKALRSSHAGEYLYSLGQEWWFEREFRLRREYYEHAVASDPAAHNPEAHFARARKKITDRGHTIRPLSEGEVHTYAYVPSNWPHQGHIARALRQLGPVSRFDYAARDITLASLRSGSPGYRERRQELHLQLLLDIRRVHRERPIDWFFSYATGFDMNAETVCRIREELGVPMVNISLDDKNWWDTIERRDVESGMKNFVVSYDLGWTSASCVLPWYWAEGGQAMFLAEGVDSEWFAPVDVSQDIDVGFVGNCFGYRPRIIESLRRAGIPVEVHGHGWPFPASPLSDDEMRAFFSRCRINLGLGDMSYSRWMTNLKGRDFEAPSCGRGLYLTSYNVDLASCFAIGQEIECYRGIDELIELVRQHLRNPERISSIARKGRERCLAEHQWIHRYRRVLTALGLLATSAM